MFVERKTRIDLRNRGSETGRDLPGAHRVLGSYGTLGDKVCVCVCGGRLRDLGVPAVSTLCDLGE